MGYFSNSVTTVDGLSSYSPATDETSPVESRVRSYLAANCAQCHQPGGSGTGDWDARFSTPLSNAGIINGALVESQGDPDDRVVKPGSLANSALFRRVSELGSLHMPPLATTELNHEAVDLLTRWITNELVALDLRLLAGNLAYTAGFQWGVTRVTTPAFIIGSGANRAAMIMVAMSANNATGIA